QAGRILRVLHSGGTRRDSPAAQLAVERSFRWLSGRHRIDPEQQHAAERILTAHPPGLVTAAPCHGDWQPRNWLVDDRGTVQVIDFGRFDWRPPETDFARLAAQQWRTQPELETAFFRGYGHDPRDDNPLRWRLTTLHEAIATAAWAYQVGAEEFEMQGHRMLKEALENFGRVDRSI
ncbi:MAG TPA: phosphotransferase, partial [Deinococcales bacterium]|nr:phosphotransferase [Deinococcales bacterium]